MQYRQPPAHPPGSSFSRDLETELLGLLELQSPLAAYRDVLRFDSHNTTSPAPPKLGVVVELRLHRICQALQFMLVILLATQGREPDNQVNWLHIVCDDPH